MCNAKPAGKMKYIIWLGEIYTLSQRNPSAKLLAGRTYGARRLLRVSVRALLHNDYRGVVDGLHDSGQATAQVVGLVDVDFGWVFKDYCLSRTVQNPGQELTQLHLQWVWKQEEQKEKKKFRKTTSNKIKLGKKVKWDKYKDLLMVVCSDI